MSLTPPRSLHAVQVGFYNDPAGRSPRQLLDAWPTLVDVAEAARRARVRGSVVEAGAHRERVERRSVDYPQECNAGWAVQHPRTGHLSRARTRLSARAALSGRLGSRNSDRPAGPCEPAAANLATPIMAARTGSCGRNQLLRAGAVSTLCGGGAAQR